jgi:hypothetical protein
LLNSRSNRFPDGLANRSGLVGRNLMFHPYAIGHVHLTAAANGTLRLNDEAVARGNLDIALRSLYAGSEESHDLPAGRRQAALR